MGHIITFTTPRLCCCSWKEAIWEFLNEWMCLASNQTLFIKAGGGLWFTNPCSRQRSRTDPEVTQGPHNDRGG